MEWERVRGVGRSRMRAFTHEENRALLALQLSILAIIQIRITRKNYIVDHLGLGKYSSDPIILNKYFQVHPTFGKYFSELSVTKHDFNF